MRVARAVVVAFALSGAVAACGSDQDPGLTPEGSDGGPPTTSRVLEACPAGGPDASTSPAGCLDDDGKVVRP